MIKKILLTLIGIFILGAVSLTVYWNLPIEVTRHSDIEYGNKLVLNLENYQKEHKSLPRYNDWNTLHQLGFKQQDLGVSPDYAVDSTGTYELVYLEGFDGPYLMYSSREKKWSIDFPKVFKR
ncbi:MAG TPA: hypothetical protein DIT10_06745 [Chryseobacterium sp.]|nr:hypothetical protein [Chryseobacterium sp.]